MVAHITEGHWSPFPGALPEFIEPDSVYVIPTRGPAEGSVIPRYAEAVRYLPKEARAANLPVRFSRDTESREFLSEYSIEPDMWSLGLACMQMANDWIILTVSLFIAHRGRAQGWSKDQAKRLPLKVYVAETATGKNYEIEGAGEDVLKAIKVLQKSNAGTDAVAGKAEDGNDHEGDSDGPK